MDTVKFRKEVPEKIRNAVRDYMRGKELCELQTGVAEPISGLHQYLIDEGYRVVVHVYGLEIVPLKDWVKEEIAAYPDRKDRDILRKHLVKCGYSAEKVDELMKES